MELKTVNRELPLCENSLIVSVSRVQVFVRWQNFYSHQFRLKHHLNPGTWKSQTAHLN